MAKIWKFNSSKKGRRIELFENFANSAFASDAVNNIHKTYLGMTVIDHINCERNIAVSVENMGSCYGHYIPQRRNLRSKDNADYENLDALIMIDKKDVDKTFLPFILSHEGFHALQDRESFSGLLPMYNNGVIYNPKYRLGEKGDFVRAFKTMERACDVVSLCILWEMKKQGISSTLFNQLLDVPHTRDMASCIQDTGEWASNQPGFLKRDVMDFCMFWGNMAGLWSECYNGYLDKAAVKTYGTTESSPIFSNLESLPSAKAIEFSHFTLISDSFGKRAWDIDREFEAIESHALKMRNKKATDKIKAVDVAYQMEKRHRKNPQLLIT